jgi:hypothetical protein
VHVVLTSTLYCVTVCPLEDHEPALVCVS